MNHRPFDASAIDDIPRARTRAARSSHGVGPPNHGTVQQSTAAVSRESAA